MVLLHIFQGGGGPTFSRGGGVVPLLISIETHITITCDFQGVWTPYPPLGPHMDNVAFWHESAQTSLCGLLLSLETSNANWSIVCKLLAKALIRLRICAGWSKPLVLAYTTLLEISYCGPFIGAKKCITAVCQDEIAFVS